MQHDLLQLAPRLTEEDALRIVADRYGLYGETEALPSERDQNFRITIEDGAEYVLKVANAAEERAALDLQNQAMRHVAGKASQHRPGCPLPTVDLEHRRSGDRQDCRR